MVRSRVTVPAFLGGISQQSDAIRRSNSVDSAVNIEFLASQGASKRYPTEHIKEITSAPTGARRAIFFDRDDAGLIALVGSTIKVVDTEGTSYSVFGTPTGGAPDFSYLSGASFRQIRSQTVADAAFVVNTDTIVESLPGRTQPAWARPLTGAAQSQGEAGFFVKQSNYGVNYSLEIKTATMSESEIISFTVASPSDFQEGRRSDFLGVLYETSLGTAITAGQAAGTDPIILEDGFQNGGGGSPGVMFANHVDDMFFKTYTGSVPGGVIVATLPPEDFEFDTLVPQRLWYKGTTLVAGSQLSVTRKDLTLDYYLESSHTLRRIRERLEARFDGVSRPLITLENSIKDTSLRISFNEAIEIFEVRDSVSDTYSSGWTDSVEDITDLPLVFKHGAVVRIAGQNGDPVDDYFVEFATEEWARETNRDFDQFDDYEGFGQGEWIETTERGLATGTLDASTMPHLLQRHVDVDGTVTGVIDKVFFHFGPAEWSGRDAGGELTNPDPSIVGNTINDVVFVEDRLGFIAGNSLVLSESGEATNLYRTTVLALPDSDRIDVDLTSLDGDNLQHAVPFDTRLLAFGSSAQAQVSGNGFLAPRSIQAPLVANYQCFPDVSPVVQGRSVFFGAPTGPYAQLREFVPGTQSEVFQDALVTLAVPELVPRTVRKLIASSVDQTLLVLTDEPNTLYVYQYLREQGNLYQASWTTWEFPEAVLLDCGFIREVLYFVFERDGQVYLEKATVGSGRTDNSNAFKIRADRLALTLGSSYDKATGLTTFTVPWDFTEDSDIILITAAGGDIEYGAQVPVFNRVVGSNFVRALGDFEGQPMYVGILYDATLTMSKPIAKRTRANGSEINILGGWQNVQDLTLYLSNTGYLEATVEQVGYDEASDEFFGEQLGVGKLDAKAVRSGEFNVGIFGDPEEFRLTLSNPTVLPSNIVSGAWSIQYNSRLPTR